MGWSTDSCTGSDADEDTVPPEASEEVALELSQGVSAWACQFERQAWLRQMAQKHLGGVPAYPTLRDYVWMMIQLSRWGMAPSAVSPEEQKWWRDNIDAYLG